MNDVFRLPLKSQNMLLRKPNKPLTPTCSTWNNCTFSGSGPLLFPSQQALITPCLANLQGQKLCLANQLLLLQPLMHEYPSPLNTPFLLATSDYNQDAAGTPWFKSSLSPLLPFLQISRKLPPPSHKLLALPTSYNKCSTRPPKLWPMASCRSTGPTQYPTSSIQQPAVHTQPYCWPIQ